MFFFFLQRLKQAYSLNMLNNAWRKQNTQNFTSIGNYFDLAKVSVGRYSYGTLNVLSWDKSERLQVGSFVSIADEVEFILGGNHPLSNLTTYPIKVMLLHQAAEAESKGAIQIDDDVWIGRGAKILSGVHIGQGAVIAAGAIVVKNVKPYEVVGGVPATHIKFRFTERQRTYLANIDWKLIPESFLKENADLFYNENIDKIIESGELNAFQRAEATLHD